ncbi:type I-E CRISPR-associated protein Cas7/Cse4/CasC [Xylocopilactobacillus apis]|uniref:Type I-E CRISPR-associated protein Cas7/Cse4/CasC n=1 Tax=Xylocopilactobacillus apis TaxID=2932183 RepID=A0AAU9DPQ6_9LACO|nr:type I-E CRISPR-associated protein Cas7/Cse4/CasC [Xylocopilactobacillus apis]BDR57038.1 type I-E CRISPR-associated protein Cas7/Cse4/CasC [Xylocopilactobacillus apis]
MTNKNNLYLDINVLQAVPSSNINRDDTGAPKTALYGGVIRSRVSSQSWKRAMRHALNDKNLGSGLRTVKLAQLLKEKIMSLDSSLSESDADNKVKEVFKSTGIKQKKEDTAALLLVSQGQVEKIAQYLLDHEEIDKKELKEIFNGNQSVDLALFGRMVADNPELNVEGSSQVAHAISTHEVVPEFDYFTALDDLQKEDTTGATMLGSIEYNSSTLYRYANLNFPELVHNLGAETAVEGAVEFIKSFVLSMPTGKQNTFANKTLPNYVMISFRTDTPVNLVSAFEEPVKSNRGYVKPSIKKLEKEYQNTLKMVDTPIKTLILSMEEIERDKDSILKDDQVTDLNELLSKVSEELQQVVQNENDND